MKKCKYCKSEIDDKARICPVCKKKQKRPVLGILLVIVGVLLFIGAVAPKATSSVSSTASSAIKEKVDEVNPVNLENFGKIETGMTYEEVCSIFGSEGELMSEVDIGTEDLKTQMYCWYDISHIANCNVTFQGGGVVSKAQVGLK